MRTFNGGASSSFVGQRTSFQPRDCHGMMTFNGLFRMNSFDLIGEDLTRCLPFSSVKLRIKSFRVPELLVEIPESSTVGSLKVSIIDYNN